MKLHFLVLFSLFTQSVFATIKAHEPDPKFSQVFIRQTNQCNFEGKKFEIIMAGFTPGFKGEGEGGIFGTPTIWIRSGKRVPLLIMRDNYDLKYGEFKAVENWWDQSEEICYGFAAFRLAPNIIAITIEASNRPGGNGMVVIAYDVLSHRVLGKLKPQKCIAYGSIDGLRGALISTDYAKVMKKVASDTPGFFWRTNDCRSEASWGEAKINGSDMHFRDESLGIVEKVFWEKGTIVSRVHPEMTAKVSFYSRFFVNDEAFKKASGFNSDLKKFDFEMIWVAKKKESKYPFEDLPVECVQFAKKREVVKSDSWICKTYR